MLFWRWRKHRRFFLKKSDICWLLRCCKNMSAKSGENTTIIFFYFISTARKILSYAYEFLCVFNLAIITLAERLIHLYIKANKNFPPSVIKIHIFLHYIFQINTCSTKYDNKMSDKRKWVVRVLLSISLQRASLKRGYSDRFF